MPELLKKPELIFQRAPAVLALLLLFFIYPARNYFFAEHLMGSPNGVHGPWIGVVLLLGFFSAALLALGWKFRGLWLYLILLWSWMRFGNRILFQTPEWTFVVLIFIVALLEPKSPPRSTQLWRWSMIYVAVEYLWFGFDKFQTPSLWLSGDFLHEALQMDFFRASVAPQILSVVPEWVLKILTWVGLLAELTAPLILFSRRFFNFWTVTLILLHIGGLLAFTITPVSLSMLFFHAWLWCYGKGFAPVSPIRKPTRTHSSTPSISSKRLVSSSMKDP